MSRIITNANVSHFVASVRVSANVAVLVLRRLHLHLMTALGRGSTKLFGWFYQPEPTSEPWSLETLQSLVHMKPAPMAVRRPDYRLTIKRCS
jgi:hypothetical protein